jgi:DNA-binding MarR family transcriptional regulator
MNAAKFVLAQRTPLPLWQPRPGSIQRLIPVPNASQFQTLNQQTAHNVAIEALIRQAYNTWYPDDAIDDLERRAGSTRKPAGLIHARVGAAQSDGLGPAGLPSREQSTSGPAGAFHQLVHNMLAFAGRIQDARNRFGQLIGLSGTAYTILIAIAYLEGEDGVGVNQIADHLHLSSAFVTVEVNKLVSSGLVEKKTNPSDRRRVQITVTSKARTLLHDLTAIQKPTNDVLFGDLSGEELHVLRGLIARLVNSGDRALNLLDYLADDRPSRGVASKAPRRSSPGMCSEVSRLCTPAAESTNEG